jgi:TRAP-type mannitol/chloroaromatic compound transport system substrate-binding protein
MKRRRFLKAGLTASVAGAGAASFPAPALSQGRMEWRMVTSWSRKLPGPGSAAGWLAERIAALSGGRLTVKVHPAGDVVPASGVFDAVSQGTAEMYYSMPSFWRAKSIGIVIFGAVPFGLMAGEQQAWMTHGGGQVLYDEIYERFNLKGFLCGNTGNQWMGWFKKEIRSVEDFKGLRYRSPGLGGEMFRRIGASIVQLPGAEIVQALQSGALDAAEFIGPWTDAALGFQQAAKFYYWPGVQEPGSAEECVVNKAKYDALPNDLKEIVAAACRSTYDYATSEYVVHNPPALQELVSKHNVQVRKAPRDLLVACGNAAGDIVDELRQDKDDLVRRIVDSFLKFRALAVDNALYTEHAMMDARMLPYKYRI